MARLIDADARVTVQSFDVEHEEYNYTEMSVAEALDFATDEGCPPTVDAAPIVHAKLIEEPGYYHWHCSACGFVEGAVLRLFYHYCPNCGAKFDGGVQDND